MTGKFIQIVAKIVILFIPPGCSGIKMTFLDVMKTRIDNFSFVELKGFKRAFTSYFWRRSQLNLMQIDNIVEN